MRAVWSLFCLAIGSGIALHGQGVNVALRGTAFANAPLYANWSIAGLINGDTSGVLHGDTAPPEGFAYSVRLDKSYAITQIKLYPRQDGCCPDRFTNLRISIHGAGSESEPGAEVWRTDILTDGSNPGSGPGTVVTIDLPAPQNGVWVKVASLANPVPDYALQMTEIQIFAEVPASEKNHAQGTLAFSNRPLYGGTSASVLVDGNRGNTAHGGENIAPGFAYQINLGTEIDISSIVIFPRQDGCCPERLTNFRVSLHQDNGGALGTEVWRASLYTDGTFPPSEGGTRETLTASLDPSGVFKGQWLQILSLDDPPADYALQINEIEVYGTPAGSAAVLINQQPRDAAVGLGNAAVFSVGVNVVGGDASQVTYQWQENGVNIPGAVSSSYTNSVVLIPSDGKKYRVIISYPGLADTTSNEALLNVNYALNAAAFSNRPLWTPAGWSISKLVNGDRGDVFHGDTEIEPGMAYSVRLETPLQFSHIDIYPRQDGCCPERLTQIRVSIHDDNNGAIGAQVWSADYFTDDTNAGSGPGRVVRIQAADNPSGKFEGRWIRILSLEDPVQNYALQMTELEAFGTPLNTQPSLRILQQPASVPGAPGRSSTISVAAAVFNGDAALITYQWKKNGAAIPGATSAAFETGPLADSDLTARYSVTVSFPGLPSIDSQETQIQFDYNYARGSRAYSNRTLWGGWNIDLLVDGNLSGIFHGSENIAPGFAYEVDLGDLVVIEKILIYPRQDTCCPERLTNFRVSVHAASNGQIGTANWSADLFTDGSHPESGPGSVLEILGSLDPAGAFRGQWVRIASLEDPVQNYALQMTEIQVIGRLEAPLSLTLVKTASGYSITWTDGALESSETLAPGSWSPVTGGASPYPLEGTGRRFFRLRKN